MLLKRHGSRKAEGHYPRYFWPDIRRSDDGGHWRRGGPQGFVGAYGVGSAGSLAQPSRAALPPLSVLVEEVGRIMALTPSFGDGGLILCHPKLEPAGQCGVLQDCL